MLGITENEVKLRLAVDNPWWRDAALFQEDMQGLPRRDLFTSFHELLTNLSIQRAPILMGPRRVGKSMLIRQVIAQLLADDVPATDILYVSLDTPVYTGLFLEQILRIAFTQDGILDRRTRYVFFDEVQYLKEWERHLKSLVDALPHIRFCASGSAAAALKMKSNESGAGRFTDFYLPGLSFAEFVRFAHQTDNEEFKAVDWMAQKGNERDIAKLNEIFIEYINFGGFPEIALGDEIRNSMEIFVRNDIVDKVLLRDLPSLYGIDDIQELNRLFTMIAYRSGGEFSLDALSQEANVSKNTLKKYISYLEAAFLIFKMPRIDASAGKFKRENNFKIYLTIPSLRSALFGMVDEQSGNLGELVETGIAAQFVHTNMKDDLYYARWNRGEVDFVRKDAATGKILNCIEVKWTDRFFFHPEELKGIFEFSDKSKPLHIMCTTKSKIGVNNIKGISIQYLPSSVYSYLLSRLIGNDPSVSINYKAIQSEDLP